MRQDSNKNNGKREEMTCLRIWLYFSLTTKTLAVTSRKRRKINRRPKRYEDTCAPAARSFYAKDHEHCASGRSPDFWLKRFSGRLPILTQNSGLCSFRSLLSCSPVTVARLRRICTDFPILPGSHTGH